jgi:AcrR family transcriptional regulator
MTNLTEQKLLAAALKMFAENGYAGARTRLIAKEAGLSEMTLFRKFKTKENLFNVVLVQNQEKILKDFDSIFMSDKFGNCRDFLKSLMDKLVDVIENNYDYVKVFLNERCRISETIIDTFIKHLAKYIENNSLNDKIDYQVFAFTVLSFVYFLLFDENQGRHVLDHKIALERFIDNSVLMLEA